MKEGLLVKPRMVEIEWVDSATTRGWNSPGQFVESPLAHCRTVGYLLKRTKKYVVVVQSLGDDTHNAGEGLGIPASCVKRLRRLTCRGG